MLHRFCCPFLCLLTCVGARLAADQPPQLRLPETVAPRDYRVALKLDPDQTNFSGHIEIKIVIQHPVETIWLNATSLSISDAMLTMSGKVQAAKIVPGGSDFVGLRFDTPLETGAAQIAISYTGQLRSKESSGIFREQEDGRNYIFTQFEETDARAAFPCFDEPSYKVPWQLTLEVPKVDDAVSNTPVDKEETNGDNKILHFRQTKPLPSYLVAFAIGQFDFVPAGFAGVNHAPVRIVTPKGHAKEAEYAAEITATILTRLEDYFGIPFPYEKSDQVAIPSTYGFGAMENAGMVTYEQNVLLGNPDRDTIRRQRVYASIAAHELAHQWFGDLVTTAWWNDIWLNEAFATWMEQKLLAEWKPEWGTRVSDVDSKLGAEAEDTLVSSRKIRQEIKTKDDISNAFDGITYQKGAAVIGMFENWVSGPAFRKGVQAYLRQYAFKNATAPEFLAAVSSAIGKDISQPFSTFLNQPGVPLVSVRLDCRGGSTLLHMEQQRSLPLNTEGSRDQVWQIPVCIRYGNASNSESACTVMRDPRADWSLKAQGCPAWVEANDKALGYYRVAYDEQLLTSLTDGDVEHRLSAGERVDLMGDAQALSNTGKLQDGEILGLVPKFRDDPNRFVLERAISIAKMPSEHLVGEDLLPDYRRFILKNFQARAREVGWNPKAGETSDIRLLRPDLLQFVATVGGDQILANQARELTSKWFADHNAIPADEVTSVLETTAYYGNKALFDQFLTQFTKTQDRQERRRILSAMRSFNDPSAIQEGMEAVLSGEIPFMEGQQLLYAGQTSAKTRTLAFAFMKTHFDELAAKRTGGGGSDAGAGFVQSGRSFCDPESEQELKTFFEPRVEKFVGAPRLLAQTLESIRSCIANKAIQKPSVEAFLRRQ